MQNHEENPRNLTPDLVSSVGVNKPAFKISSLSRRNKYRKASGDFLGEQKTSELQTNCENEIFFNDNETAERNQFGAGDSNVNTIDSNNKSSKSNSENTERLASIGITVSKLLSSALIHPFIVLRRQCQVNNAGRKYHLTPFTVINVAISVQSSANQATFCMWKGVSSNLWLFAQTLAAQSAIEAATNGRLKQDLPDNFTLVSFTENILLKAIVAALTSPMYSVYVVSCVKVDLDTEDESLLTCLSNSFQRVFHTGNFSSPRLIPFYKLLISTVALQTARYALVSLLERLILRIMKLLKIKFHKKQIYTTPKMDYTSSQVTNLPSNMDYTSSQITNLPPNKNKLLEVHYPQLISAFLAELIADVILYPVETTLHRIVLKGTRTILYNMDTGRGFTSVGTKYDGFTDCWHKTVESEGKLGLYRGFGCLVLQHCVKYVVIKTVHFGLEYLSS